MEKKSKRQQKAPHSSHKHGRSHHTDAAPPPLNWEKEKNLPVTILIGFLGAGKTTLLKYVLENTEGKKIAVIVNDLAEVNVDAALVKKKKSKAGGNRKMVELTNGCMCCSLKDDLLVAIRDLAKKGAFDYLIIEASGVAEPLPVVEGIFHFDVGRGKVLADIVRLDAMITLIDAKQFLADFHSKQGVMDREELVKEMGLAPPPIKGKKATKKEKKLAENLKRARDNAANHPISALLAEQVEFANLLVLNKTDTVSEEELLELEDIVHALNPDALIKKSEFGRLPLDELLNVRLFDFEKASTSAGWLKVLNGEYEIKAKKAGINNFVYKARRPFHPKRLWDLVEGSTLDSCVRSKGFFWLATWNDVIGDWAHAGDIFNYQAGGPWFATVPESEWPGDEQAHIAIRKDFDSNPSIGDRRQELVFIGIRLDEAAIREKLDQCLLTEEEMQLGLKAWLSFEDPFRPFFVED